MQVQKKCKQQCQKQSANSGICNFGRASGQSFKVQKTAKNSRKNAKKKMPKNKG